MQFVDVKNDVAFRKIFGNENKKEILISFLNAVLELENLDRIKDVKLIDPYLLPRIRGEKASIIDVRAKDNRGRSFIIEMQVAEKDGFGKRIQFYTSKEYSSQINRGDDYTKLKPVYFIGILDFSFFPGTNYLSKHIIVDEETGICTLDDIKFRFIELKKFKKKENELKSVIDKWTYFIKKAEKLEVIPENIDDKGLLAAYEEAKKHNWSKTEYDAYIYAGMREQDAKGELSFAERKGLEKGIEQGIEKGIKKGIEQQLRNSVIGLYENNVPVNIIVMSLKVTEEIVKQIIEEEN
jgi:predicted transposase/invertase (TIGR01784 family)